MLNTKPSRYGDLKKFIITVDGKDVSLAVDSVEIYQDLFTPTWSAHVRFNDTTNLLMTIPFKPGSVLTVSIETENNGPGDGEKEFEFVVYRIGEKVFQNHMQQTYTLFCASRAFLFNQGKRVSKCYSEKKATAIAAEIVSEHLGGSVESTEADDNVHVIIPNWSPFNAVAWCCKHATNKRAADYVFFQRDSDSYVMKPMEELYNSKSESCGVVFNQRPAEIKKDGEYENDYSVSIFHYEVEHYDGASNLSAGYYKNKKLSYDMVNKKWEEKIFTYGDDCSDDAQMKSWDDPLFDGAEDANVTFLPKHPGIHEKHSYLDKQDIWEGSRKSAIQKLDQEKLFIQVPGSAGFNEFIGKNCEVELPSQQDMDPEEKLDKYRKGRYLIIAMSHMLSRSGYVCNLELVKKRLEESV